MCSLEMEPKLWQLIISSWMLHNKSREFIRGPEVPSSSKVGVRQSRQHHPRRRSHKLHHKRRLGYGNWTIEKRELKLLSNRNCLIFNKNIFYICQKEFRPQLKVMFVYLHTPFWHWCIMDVKGLFSAWHNGWRCLEMNINLGNLAKRDFRGREF